jgi:hypothetical protein
MVADKGDLVEGECLSLGSMVGMRSRKEAWVKEDWIGGGALGSRENRDGDWF